MGDTYIEIVVKEYNNIMVSSIQELYELGEYKLGKEYTRDEADKIISSVLEELGMKPLVEMWRKTVQDAI